jgi:3-hydroxy-9,10-secoandrosta-1,3,5(10)-triene-9,17-dione monooxygenase reductase component
MIDPQTFRRVLGHLPTGVSVITGDCVDGPAGVSCNSVTSVSLDPPLIAFCPARSSETWPALRSVGRFCVNFMAEHHEEMIRAFARKRVNRFAGVGHHPRLCGPALNDAIAWLDCELRTEQEAGDHFIVLAQVIALDAAADGAPLVFFRGRYGTFAPRTCANGGADTGDPTVEQCADAQFPG